MKRSLSILIGVLLMLSLVTLPAYADRGGKGDCCGDSCPMKSGKYDKGGDKSHDCPLMDKFMKKAHFFLENKDEIGLSEEQVKTIKRMKMEQKKNFIRQMAEFQVFQIDLKEKLSEPKIDIEGTNALIDHNMGTMSTNAKAGVEALAKLKGVLSDSQMAKAKELHNKK